MFGALGRRAGALGLLPGGASGLVPLIQGAWLHPALTFSRASAAAFLRSTDGALVEVESDQPRFDPDLGLVIEGQGTNGVRNPRGEGFLAGVPGSGPTNWSLGPAAELSVERIGTATVQGVPGIVIRIRAAAPLTVSSNCLVRAEGTQQVAATPGQTWTAGMYAALVSGSLPPGTTVGAYVIERSAAGGFLAQAFTNDPPTTTLRRALHTRVISNGSTAFVQPDYAFVFPAGVQPDFQVFLALPSIVQGAITTSPILPAVGTPTTTTRLADLVPAALTSLGIPASGACTIAGTFIASALADGNFIYLDDGAGTSNTWRLRTFGNEVYLSRTNAGAFANAAVVGTFTAGAPFRVALSVDGSGNASACINGGTVRGLTGGVAAGLTTLRVGHAFGGGGNFVGSVRRLGYLPRPTADAALPALSLRGVPDLTGMQEIIQWP